MTEPVLDRLVRHQTVEQRVMIVLAHPDDETLAIGAQLCRLRDALLVYITDGAPRDGKDAAWHGFTSVAEYGAARRRELAAALAVGKAAHLRTTAINIADQEAHLNFDRLIGWLRELIDRERPAAIFTHAYEGGHPDHDAAAFAVAAACRLVAPPAAPAFAMPLYRADGDAVAYRSVLPGTGNVTKLHLSAEDRARKARMIACFTSQAMVLADLPIEPERFAIMPEHDFTRPPHLGRLHYERLGWGIRGAEWRERAAAASVAFGLC